MNLATFTELIEFKILSASLFPFITGLFFSWYFLGSVNGLYATLFFIAMILFDATVNVLDNFNDYYHSDKDEYKSKTNIIGREHISPALVVFILAAFIIPSAGIGLYLTYKSACHCCGWEFSALRSGSCIHRGHDQFPARHLGKLPLGLRWGS